MTKRIFKYPLHLTDEQTIEMPKGAQIVHTDNQAGTLCVWAWVDDEQPLVWHRIAIVGTGHDVSRFDPATLVGVIVSPSFVWHILDLGEVEE